MLATIAAMLGGLAGSVEGELRTWRDSVQRSEASGDVVILEVDSRSIQAINSWPWPRSLYADALAELGRLDAGQIAFDIDFSSPSTPAEDRRLAQQLEQLGGNVILPTFRQIQTTGGANIVIENMPLPELARHAFLASVNVHPQADGQVTSYPYGVTTSGTPRPSLASMMAGQWGDIERDFRIDQAIDPTTIPRISFVDLLEGRVAKDHIAGRNIIIGATAIELGDRYPTGLYGVIPGVLIQAQATETLLHGRARADVSTWLVLAFTAISLTAFAAIGRLGMWLSHGVVIASAGMAILALVLDARSGAYIALAPFAIMTIAYFTAHRILRTTARLRNARMTDGLTGLPNRHALITRRNALGDVGIVTARIANVEQLETLVDTNRASSIDRGFAERMTLMAMDGEIYRLERGVFGWIVSADQAEDLTQYFTTARTFLNAPIEVDGQRLKLVASFGFAHGHITNAMAAAEHAYQSSALWSDTIIDLQQKSKSTQDILLELDEALENGAIWVAYQAKYRFSDKTVSGAECLIRWNSPHMGTIGPEQFIPVLESSGKMHDLTLFVIRDALARLADAERAGLTLNLAVNVSAQLLADPDFVDEAVVLLISALPQRSGGLTIEITESAPLDDPRLAHAALAKMSAAGARISIDDYGTGQATLTYLQGFPADEVKLDQSFVRNFTRSHADGILVRSTIELAHALGFEIVAEGIEDREILDALAKLGCDYGQGWHIGKPDRWDNFLARHRAQIATGSAITAAA